MLVTYKNDIDRPKKDFMQLSIDSNGVHIFVPKIFNAYIPVWEIQTWKQEGWFRTTTTIQTGKIIHKIGSSRDQAKTIAMWMDYFMRIKGQVYFAD